MTTSRRASKPDPETVTAVIPIDDTKAALELYLLRHADAGNSALWTGVDAERPLSKKGRRQAKALARTLTDLDFRADAVISSPLIRAAQTAKPVAKAIGLDVLTDERLGYGFGRRELVAIVKQLGTGINRVVLVGHDPGFTEVVSFLVGADITMAKGALARIDLANREVKGGAGALRWLLPPDAVAR
ncbi:MAG TPA: histidine phosphatase family protein [Candidatus Limnocylindrales bacterium]|nr:histidine phosphatase family protein [Candidatus Limnocylindrales bacterium]